jgi:uncharacterized membrane protein YgdD (TMEM256/DUF423 family)
MSNQNHFSPRNQIFIVIASFLIALYIIMDAIGAHALAEHLKDSKINEWFFTSLRHLLLGAIGILVFSIFSHLTQKKLMLPIVLQFIGILLFSGSLLLLVYLKINSINYPKIFSILAPVGGFSFILSWLVFGTLLLKQKK